MYPWINLRFCAFFLLQTFTAVSYKRVNVFFVAKMGWLQWLFRIWFSDFFKCKPSFLLWAFPDNPGSFELIYGFENTIRKHASAFTDLHLNPKLPPLTLVQKSRIQFWLFEQKDMRIEGRIIVSPFQFGILQNLQSLFRGPFGPGFFTYRVLGLGLV